MCVGDVGGGGGSEWGFYIFRGEKEGEWRKGLGERRIVKGL